MRILIVVVVVLALASASAADESFGERQHGTIAKRIKTVNPRYPTREAEDGHEGWVSIKVP